MSADEISRLQREIAELTARITSADAKNEELAGLNAKAGEYGLKLIEEKGTLEIQYDQLQRDYESTRLELESTREAFNQFRNNHRNAAFTELSREESLLEDKARLEKEFMERIRILETELKTLKQKLESTQQENDRLLTEYTQISQLSKSGDNERNELKKELKELKDHEQKLLNDNDELGDENVKLQKQITTLKAAQVEFESMKIEVTRLIEENHELQSTVEEHRQLKEFAESEADKALMTAQQEREQKLKLKKELEHMRNHESILSLNSLYVGISNATKDDDQDRLNALENSIIADGPLENAFQNEHIGQDLFSEIHGGEVSKLKEENEALSNRLEDLKRGFEQAIGPLLQKLQVAGLSDSSDVAKLKDIIHEAISRLDKKLESAAINKATEKRVDQIKADLRQIILLAGLKNAQLATAQDKIIQLAEIVGQFCLELVGGDKNESEIQRVNQIQSTLKSLAEQNVDMNDKRSGSPATNADEEMDRDARSPKLHTLNISRALLSSDFEREVLARLNSGLNLEEILSNADRREKLAEENEALAKSYDSFHELFKLVRANVDRLGQSKATTEDEKNLVDMQQLLVKYKNLLNVKREQVSSLRTVLRTNKACNESALNSVQSKYQSEMKIKDETIAMLRKELKQFKEDAATFASNRAMYTTRNEELKAKNEQLKEDLEKAKEEHKIMNQLLQMAIKQKLVANQRAADLEMACEHTIGAKRPIRPPNTNHSAYQREPRAVRYPQQSHNLGQNGNSNQNAQFPPRGVNPK